MSKYVFFKGVQAAFSLVPGVLPFGLIMGTLASSSHLEFYELLGLNVFVFAGASQLVALDLINHHIPAVVVIFTGACINLRHLMYSASVAPHTQKLGLLHKFFVSYLLTDQAYAISNLEFERSTYTKADKIIYYTGAGAAMWVAWQLSTLAGYIFGSAALGNMSLDFGVPLTFLALVVPTLKNKVVIIVALSSFIISTFSHAMPYKLGLIVAALSSLAIGMVIQRMSQWRLRRSHG